ncbi:MAG: GWxTD domain-containing protein [Acidobacteriaceae bacterium]
MPVRAKSVSSKQLPQHYREWIEEDVPYIISEDEKNEFLRLKTDDERDKFIEAFWEARNPDPHSFINTYKEEHYRRLAYVRDTFGDRRYNDGWRTDMGRVYITLGPPKQRAPYHIGISTRELELWFYQSPSPALPPYFNLVFYKRSESEPYTLYSPREDGPARILTNDAGGTESAQALKTIQASMGAEVAHAMITLFPDEHVDLRDPQPPSLDSDFLLAAVRNLPDQKLEKQRIAARKRALQEKVTSSIFTGANVSVLDTAVLRDDQGRETVHFLLRNQQIDPRLIGILPDKKTGYSLSLQTRVMTANGKAVYQQQDTLQGVVSEAGAKTAKERLFAAEGRLPLVPGSYEIEATLTNNLTHEGTRTRKNVTVTDVHPDGVGISDLVAFTKPSPVSDPEGQLPFSMSKLRFTPRGPQTVQIHVGETLPLAYQIWFPLADLKGADQSTPKTVHVHYVVGMIATSADRTPLEEDEDVEVKNLDAAGNLLTGRTLDTSRLAQGTYRLVAKVTEAGTPRSAYATMTVKILPPEVTVGMWTAFGPESRHPAWQEDVQRGVAAEALGHDAEAALCYRRALAVKPDAADVQTRLDALTQKESARNSGGK